MVTTRISDMAMEDAFPAAFLMLLGGVFVGGASAYAASAPFSAISP